MLLTKKRLTAILEDLRLRIPAELEKELLRKDKALAEAAAIIILKKKVQSIWGDEDEPTDKKNGR